MRRMLPIRMAQTKVGGSFGYLEFLRMDVMPVDCCCVRQAPLAPGGGEGPVATECSSPLSSLV